MSKPNWYDFAQDKSQNYGSKDKLPEMKPSEVSPQPQPTKTEAQKHMDKLDILIKGNEDEIRGLENELYSKNKPETEEEANARMKEERKHALIDGIGGAMTGIANLVGGVSGGYAFPENQKPKEESPIEKARRERLERAKQYYNINQARLNNLYGLRNRLLELKYSLVPASQREVAQNAAAENATRRADTYKESVDSRKKVDDARANYLNRKDTTTKTNNTTRGGGGSRAQKDNAPYLSPPISTK